MKLVLPLLLICSNIFAQLRVPVDRFNFYIDYNNLDLAEWYGESDLYTLGSEIGLTELFSLDLGGAFEGDGRADFAFDPGLGAGGLQGWKYSNTSHRGWAMLRLYPVEQWHSESLRIRHKENYGVYFAIGYGASFYNRRNLVIESLTRVIIDDATGEQLFVDSSLFHYNGYSILQWGQQFGVGWKQYHNRYIYTDIGLMTDAYRRRNRRVTGWRIDDPRRQQDGYYLDDQLWNKILESVETWGRNGKGLIVTARIGVNLDIRK